MTEYTDVPQANLLYSESERVQLAISNIDAGASLTSFVIGVPPASLGPQPISPTGATIVPTAVTIWLDAPASDQMMTDLRAWLVQRQGEINDQLAALEVINPPAPPTAPLVRGQRTATLTRGGR
jgi:hypothetical protein